MVTLPKWLTGRGWKEEIDRAAEQGFDLLPDGTPVIASDRCWHVYGDDDAAGQLPGSFGDTLWSARSEPALKTAGQIVGGYRPLVFRWRPKETIEEIVPFRNIPRKWSSCGHRRDLEPNCIICPMFKR